MQGAGLPIGRNLGFSILLKDTATQGQEEPGVEPPMLRLMDDLLSWATASQGHLHCPVVAPPSSHGTILHGSEDWFWNSTGQWSFLYNSANKPDSFESRVLEHQAKCSLIKLHTNTFKTKLNLHLKCCCLWNTVCWRHFSLQLGFLPWSLLMFLPSPFVCLCATGSC